MEICTNILKYAIENMHKMCKNVQKYGIKYAHIYTCLHKINILIYDLNIT